MSEILADSPRGRRFFALSEWIFQRLNEAAASLGLGRRPLASRDLIAAAQRSTGLSDFGDWAIEEPLDLLLRSYDEEARLSAFGRMAVRWDILRLLGNLLRLQEDAKNHPAILAEKIERPIFIAGMPRSGTSFLHELLGEDRANRTVRVWEAIYPLPLDPRADAADAEDEARRCRKVDRELAIFNRITPEIRNLHPITASSPQECAEVTAHILRSQRFETTTQALPAYRTWLDRAQQVAAYRFHKRFLQHLQYRRGKGCWVLKCPDHVLRLEAIRAVYPDARFVFMHRDPVAVLPSVARLAEALRRPFTKTIDRRRMGAELAHYWRHAASIMIDLAATWPASAEPPLHIRFADFTRDPAAAAVQLYRHFGLPLDAAAASRIGRLAARKPKGGNGHNPARLEDYGLEAAQVRRRFRDYIDRFALDT